MKRNRSFRAFFTLLALTLCAPAGCDEGISVPPNLGEAPPFVRQWGGYGPNGVVIDRPSWLAVDAEGSVYVVEQSRGAIQKYTGDGSFVLRWELPKDGEPRGPFVDAIAAGSDRVYVSAGGWIRVFDAQGDSVAAWRGGTAVGGLALTPEGDVLVSGYSYLGKYPNLTRLGLLLRLSPEGEVLEQWNGVSPGAIAAGGDGAVFVAWDYGQGPVRQFVITKYSRTGSLVAQWPIKSEGSPPCQQLAVDSRGNVYATQYGGGVWEYTGSGRPLAHWVEVSPIHEPLGQALGVAVGTADHLYVTDWIQQRVVEYAP